MLNFKAGFSFAGHRLDTLARMALWDVGLDYLHGTGHGIGSFLNVHEGELRAGVRVRVCACAGVRVCACANVVANVVRISGLH